jgi:hypothetical protein
MEGSFIVNDACPEQLIGAISGDGSTGLDTVGFLEMHRSAILLPSRSDSAL